MTDLATGSDGTSYDALLVVSFGGPEGPDEVMPFLRNVTSGKSVPDERLAEVAEHYFRFGGVSPINEQCRALVAAIEADFAAHGLRLPIYWGNRNWMPYLADTLRQMAADEVRSAVVFITAAYASYSGCRQYRENLADAFVSAGHAAPRLDKLRHYFNHPGFIEPMIDNTLAALRKLPQQVRSDAHLAFTTHSIPEVSAQRSGLRGGAYVAQHLDAAQLVAEGVCRATGSRYPWQLVYSSRSGPPTQLWLTPDINDHLKVLAEQGASAVVMVPIGFISDHMEVISDLDVEAMETAATLGLPGARAATVGTDPRFVTMIRELVCERAAVARGLSPSRRALGALGPSHDLCPAQCCPNPWGRRAATAGLG